MKKERKRIFKFEIFFITQDNLRQKYTVDVISNSYKTAICKAIKEFNRILLFKYLELFYDVDIISIELLSSTRLEKG